MNLYYAMGGGLGHLTRARAFLAAEKLDKATLILTASSFADDPRIVGEIPILKAGNDLQNDAVAYQSFMRKVLDDYQIKTLFLDSFPFGIIGEFTDFCFPPKVEVNYVARLLKWQNYLSDKKVSNFCFHKTFVLENLHGDHRDFIENSSAEILRCDLVYEPPKSSPAVEEVRLRILRDKIPFWLIVHGGNNDEIFELINYAAEMREIEQSDANLILIAPQNVSFNLENFFRFDLYPASSLFESAERIFTACGFNVMQQTDKYSDKHFFIPFERRYDDQFERAARRRKSDSRP